MSLRFNAPRFEPWQTLFGLASLIGRVNRDRDNTSCDCSFVLAREFDSLFGLQRYCALGCFWYIIVFFSFRYVVLEMIQGRVANPRKNATNFGRIPWKEILLALPIETCNASLAPTYRNVRVTKAPLPLVPK